MLTDLLLTFSDARSDAQKMIVYQINTKLNHQTDGNNHLFLVYVVIKIFQHIKQKNVDHKVE